MAVVQRLLPEITSEDLEPAPSGAREETARMVNVCDAPSPAATASLNIGRLIVEKLATQFN